MSWFRRTPTPPAEPFLHPREARVIVAWELTEAEWLALTDQERTTARTNYTKAPRFIA